MVQAGRLAELNYQDNLKLTHGKVVMSKPQDFKKQLEAEVARFKKELPELGIKGE